MPGLELGKVVAAGARPRGAQTEQLVVFVLHRGDMEEFLPIATEVGRLINEQVGLEVAEVVPVKRIPKTTSGKIQRHLLEEGFVDGEFDAPIAAARGAARRRSADRNLPRRTRSRTTCGRSWKRPCPASAWTSQDNLFEIGASSLKLIEIHEQIDRQYPGLVDLTELFDFPTIAELARHLEGKLAA